MKEAMQELNKAWKQFIVTLSEELKIEKFLHFLASKLNTH